MTRQGLLHYFPSKVQLLLGVLEVRNEDNVALVAEVIERSHGFADTPRASTSTIPDTNGSSSARRSCSSRSWTGSSSNTCSVDMLEPLADLLALLEPVRPRT
jgi:hypothetical protein